MSTRILLLNWRLAFGQGLWAKSKPPKAGPDAKEKFRVTLLAGPDHPQLAQVRKILTAEATALWGAKAASIQKAAEAQQKWALRDGNLKDEYEGFAGNWALSANSFAKPTVFDQNRLPISQDSGIVYSGCYVNAIVVLKAFDNVSKGTTCELSGVQWFADGDAFSGGKPADSSEFPDEIGAPASEDPLMA